MKEITLSMKEQEKLAIIIRYSDGVLTGSDAAKQLGLTVRQVQRKKKSYLMLQNINGYTAPMNISIYMAP